MNKDIEIESKWKSVLKDEFEKPYFGDIKSQIIADIKSGKTIFPPGKLIFNAFNLTPFDKVKVVILGQDPYHGKGQAMGLCFSVPRNITRPASLLNIYKEMNRDLGIPIAEHGDLINWAEQGVFMLNAILTVIEGKAGSHANIGWQQFTDNVIKSISDNKNGIIFLLWGNFAKNKKSLIDSSKHFILESAHPSPLAGNAFQGNSHFSKTNELLISQGLEPIDWNV
ncbi:MAG: uracil-DNA glycosylase [Saprospiraceae bacterium]|nr:uracil-DNA glycosylase [Saprospiraceae bacterium]